MKDDKCPWCGGNILVWVGTTKGAGVPVSARIQQILKAGKEKGIKLKGSRYG